MPKTECDKTAVKTESYFVSGTQITIPNRESKTIEKIKKGDLVLTHLGRLREVMLTTNHNINEKIYSIKVLGIQDKMRAAKDNIFLIKRNTQSEEWIRTEKLRVSDRIHSHINGYSEITDISLEEHYGKVYSFEVEQDNSFVANCCTVRN